MALSAPRLSLALQAAHVAIGAVPGTALTTLCDGIAAAIVTELTANGEVLPTGVPPLNAPPGGGPVTGKGVIT